MHTVSVLCGFLPRSAVVHSPILKVISCLTYAADSQSVGVGSIESLQQLELGIDKESDELYSSCIVLD